MKKVLIFIFFVFFSCTIHAEKQVDPDYEELLEKLQEGIEVSELKKLKKEGLNLEARNEYEETALLKFARRPSRQGFIAIKNLALLVEAGSDLNATDKNGNTPLHLFVAWPQRYWKERDRGEKDLLLSLLTLSVGNTRIGKDEMELVLRSLITSENIKKVNDYGDTALEIAITESNIMAIPLLIEAGADLNRLDGRGRMPLHRALSSPSLKMLAQMKEEVLDIILSLITSQSIIHKDNKGRIPFDFVIEYGWKEERLLQALEQERNWKDKDSLERMIHTTILSQNWEALELFLDSGLGKNTVDSRGETLLYDMISHYYFKNKTEEERTQFIDFVKTLITKENVSLKSISGQTPLMQALRKGWADTRLLSSLLADEDKENLEELMLFSFSTSKFQIRILFSLIRHG